MEVLFLNACVRGKEISRTHYLCEKYLAKLKKEHKDVNVTTVDLSVEKFECLDWEKVKSRTALIEAKQLSHPMFDHAHKFANADIIVIGAPYWDLSFPAVLKVYVENISVTDIVFSYGPKGPIGNCKASELVYITTAGGFINDYNFGYEYFKGLADIFNIKKTKCLAAQMIDVQGVDYKKLLDEVEM